MRNKTPKLIYLNKKSAIFAYNTLKLIRSVRVIPSLVAPQHCQSPFILTDKYNKNKLTQFILHSLTLVNFNPLICLYWALVAPYTDQARKLWA